jgi:ribosomal protein S18 acetylase RimI-like enzyme
VSPKVPENVVIKRGNSHDSDVLAELWIELATDQRQHGSHLWGEDNRSQIHETMLQHVVSGTVYVARCAEGSDAERIVGFVTFGTESGKYDQDSFRGIIHNIYVEPEARGDRVGSALLDAAERELESRGVDIVALQAMADNHAAISFYKQHGYTDHRIELEKPINDDPHTPGED